MKRFSYIEHSYFNNCEECPFNKFVQSERQNFQECIATGNFIIEYDSKQDKDNRNSEGILNNCPFLKKNSMEDDEVYEWCN